MALQCPCCRRQYDVTLFQFQNVVQCDCGTVIDLRRGHAATQETTEDEATRPQLAPDDLVEGVPGTQLVLVRHGQAGPASLAEGLGEAPLSGRGRQQALDLAGLFLAEQLAAIYSSDAVRCRETAETIGGELGLSVQTTPLLRDADSGQFTREQHGPEAESRQELLDRVLRFLREAVRRHGGGTVVVVTHADCCAVVLHHVLGIPLAARSPFRVDNGSVHRIGVGAGGWHVIVLNDTCHLTRPEAATEEEDSPWAH